MKTPLPTFALRLLLVARLALSAVLLTTLVLAVMVEPSLSQAQPSPCYADLVPPGTWFEARSDGGDSYAEIGDSNTYKLVASCPLCQNHADPSGNWDWIREYGIAGLWLNNLPGVPWYSAGDTNLDFGLGSGTLTVKLRNPGGASTDPYRSPVEMEVSAHVGNSLFLATYAGQPTVTYVPETPESLGYTLASGVLESARLCVGLPDRVTGAPGLTIRADPPDGTGIELAWNTSTNHLYQVQHCSDLATPDWKDAGTPFVGTGATLQARDEIPPDAAQMYYRVLQFP